MRLREDSAPKSARGEIKAVRPEPSLRKAAGRRGRGQKEEGTAVHRPGGGADTVLRPSAEQRFGGRAGRL